MEHANFFFALTIVILIIILIIQFLLFLRRSRMLTKEIEILRYNIPGGVCEIMLDDNLTIVSCSKGFETLVGYTSDQLLTEAELKCARLVAYGDVQGLISDLHHKLSHGDCASGECRLIQRDGTPIWTLYNGTRVNDKNRHMDVFKMVFLDITATRTAERQMHIAKVKYDMAIRGAKVFIADYNVKEQSAHLSENMAEYLVLPETVNNVPRLLDNFGVPLHEQDIATFRDCYHRLIDGTNEISCDLRLKNIHTEEYQWFRATLSAIRNENDELVNALVVLLLADAEKKHLALLEREQKYRSAMLSKATVCYEADLTEDCFTLGAEPLLKLFGLPENTTYSQVVDFATQHVIHEDNAQSFYDAFCIANLLRLAKEGTPEISLTVKRKYPTEDEFQNMCYNVNVIRNDENSHITAFCYIVRC